MAELFKIRLTLLEGQKKKKCTLFARRGETLLETIQRELHDKIELRLDPNYGLEVVRVGSLSKNEKEGVHFWIGKKVPFVWEGNEKLYLSLYHIQVDRNMHLRLELVSASCDFAGSVVNPRLGVRVLATECEFEKLQSFKIESTHNSLWKMPIYSEIQSPSPFQSQSVDYFRYFLLQNLRSLGGWKKKPREPEFATDFAFPIGQAQEKRAQPQLPQFPRNLEYPAELPLLQLQMQSEAEKTGNGGLSQEQGAISWGESSIHPVSTDGARRGEISKQAAGNQPCVPPKLSVPWHEHKGFVPFTALSDFRAVIFDLDGIIVDSEVPHLTTFNVVLKKLGVQIEARTWKQNYMGVGSYNIMKDVFRRHGITGNVEPIVKERQAIYQKYIEEKGLLPIKGFHRFFSLLEKSGIKVIVASGGHKPHIAAALKSIGLPHLKFVGLEDVKNAKPHPEIFQLAAKKLNLKPNQCVVFEDSLAGVAAARAAEMPCISLSTTIPQKMLEGRAAAVFTNYNSPALKKLIRKLISKNAGEKITRNHPARKKKAKKKLKILPFSARKKSKAAVSSSKKKFRRPSLLRLGRR